MHENIVTTQLQTMLGRVLGSLQGDDSVTSIGTAMEIRLRKKTMLYFLGVYNSTLGRHRCGAVTTGWSLWGHEGPRK
jgi:hypothetical protein